jgi:uncharacterized membrane protein
MFGIFIKIVITAIIMIAGGVVGLRQALKLQNENEEGAPADKFANTLQFASVIVITFFGVALFVAIMFFIWASPIGN